MLVVPADSPIEIREKKRLSLKGVKLLTVFLVLGWPTPIATECCVHSLTTELVAVLDSPGFQSLSIIQSRAPNFPAIIHANEDLNLAIFVSELF